MVLRYACGAEAAKASVGHLRYTKGAVCRSAVCGLERSKRGAPKGATMAESSSMVGFLQLRDCLTTPTIISAALHSTAAPRSDCYCPVAPLEAAM